MRKEIHIILKVSFKSLGLVVRKTNCELEISNKQTRVLLLFQKQIILL